MATPITVHLQIFKCPQLPHFSIDLEETGIKIHVLLISFIYNIVNTKVVVCFNEKSSSHHLPGFGQAGLFESEF